MPSSTLVRLNRNMYEVLQQLAHEEETSMQDVLSRAIESYRRERFFERAREAFATLQADPEAWAQYQAEQVELEGTLMDGIDGVDEYEVPPSSAPAAVAPQ